MNDYLTVYRKDYIPKPISSLKEEIERNKINSKEFKDPICNSFKNYLCLDPCTDEFSEEIDTYFEKALKVYPGFKDLTESKPLNKDIIRKNNIYKGRTIYQIDYCDLEKEIADKEFAKRNAIVLPRDADIPLTTQKAGFRNPISLNSKAYEKQFIPKPTNNLDANHKIRKILKVTTGDSEYMQIIGKLGNRIIVEQIHGVIPLL